MELLFYDVESFKYDSLVVFKDINNKTIGKFWIDEDTVSRDISGTIKDKILVGYNNYSYDDYILAYMTNQSLCNAELIKSANDALITDKRNNRKPIAHSTLDTFQQISLSMPSLKMIEGNMGKSIIESEVSFDINRKLTPEERQIVEAYCEYDVENTIEVYKLREKSYFEPKSQLVKMLGDDEVCRYNTTTMIAQILSPNNEVKKWKREDIPEEFWKWWNMGHMPEEVLDLWEWMLQSETAVTTKGKNKTVHAYGCKFVFGMGGLHGAPTKPGRYKNIKLADVGSMYPSIIVKLGALGAATQKYDDIRKERLQIKHTDKVKANALKLILNSTYGLFKNKYSKLYNPYASAVVCMYGQMTLFKLCQMLYEHGYHLINANTDGIAFEDTGEGYEDICREWEQMVNGLTLDVDVFDQWIQKDVNNYVAKTGDHIKVKGGEVKWYHEENLFGNNNARILHIALVEKLLNDTMIAKTINQHLDRPNEFQYILRAGSTFQGTCDGSGELLPQKVNRVFATTEDVEGHTKLYKLRADDGKVMYSDTPDYMYLYNGDLSEMTEFREIIDTQHYIDIVEKRLEGWP